MDAAKAQVYFLSSICIWSSALLRGPRPLCMHKKRGLYSNSTGPESCRTLRPICSGTALRLRPEPLFKPLIRQNGIVFQVNHSILVHIHFRLRQRYIEDLHAG